MSDLIPDGWRITKFKDVFNEYKYGPRFSSKDYDPSGNVKTIRGTDVSSAGLIKYNQVPIALLDSKLVQNNQLQNGDLVMITTADCGMTAVFYEQEIPFIASAYAIRLTPSEYISSEYIKFFMQTAYAKNQIESFVRKGTVANLPGSDVMNLTITLASLPEQQKIAAILTSVDEVIEKTQAQIDKLKDLKKGMMQELLTLGVGIDGKPHTEFKDSPVGRIPKGWEVKPINELVTKVGSGVTPKGGSTAYVEVGIPLIRSQNVHSDGLKLHNVSFITDAQHKKMKNSQLQARDVLLNITGASIGRSYYLPDDFEEGNVNQHVCIIRTNASKLNHIYLSLLLNSEFGQRQIMSLQAGGNREGLNFQQIREIKLPTPPLAEQNKIASILISIGDNLHSLKLKLLATQKIKKALMQDLLTGKVRVNVSSEATGH